MMTKIRSHRYDSAAGMICSWASMILVVSVCLFIIGVVVYFGWEALSFRFLVTEPNSSAIHTEAGGILTPLVGTLLLTLLGTALAYPFSLATAIYLCFYAKESGMKTVIKTAIDILAGVPTIVIALFALAIFSQPWLSFLSAPIEHGGTVIKAYGKSFLVAGIAMAAMILPFVIKSVEEALKAVPETYMEASFALGATKWHTISKVVIPAAVEGITTGVILGMGRIIGDTAIVWLVLGGTLRMTGAAPWYAPQNWISTLQNTGCTLTSYIYFTSPAGEGNNYTVAFGAACVLIVIIIALNALIAVIGNMRRVK